MARKWTTSKIGGYAVRHPSGAPAGKIREAVSRLASEKRLSRSDRCPIIIFRAGSAYPTAVQRCEGRSMPQKSAGGRAAARRRLQARLRRGEVCRTAKGRLTKHCPARRR